MTANEAAGLAERAKIDPDVGHLMYAAYAKIRHVASRGEREIVSATHKSPLHFLREQFGQLTVEQELKVRSELARQGFLIGEAFGGKESLSW